MIPRGKSAIYRTLMIKKSKKAKKWLSLHEKPPSSVNSEFRCPARAARIRRAISMMSGRFSHVFSVVKKRSCVVVLRFQNGFDQITRLHAVEAALPLRQRRNAAQDGIEIQLAARQHPENLLPHRPIVAETAL